MPADRAGETGNPFCQWIGGAIRADPWGYAAPGLPEQAAGLAWRDAYLSHRRNGIYAAMYFAAAIAAAFAVDHPVRALEVGLSEIPKTCALAKAVRWALKVAPGITDYRTPRVALDHKFAGMHDNTCRPTWWRAPGQPRL